jgi:hypothetical protein
MQKSAELKKLSNPIWNRCCEKDKGHRSISTTTVIKSPNLRSYFPGIAAELCNGKISISTVMYRPEKSFYP